MSLSSLCVIWPRPHPKACQTYSLQKKLQKRNNILDCLVEKLTRNDGVTEIVFGASFGEIFQFPVGQYQFSAEMSLFQYTFQRTGQLVMVTTAGSATSASTWSYAANHAHTSIVQAVVDGSCRRHPHLECETP